MNANDGLPSNICNECLERANHAVEFRTECERSDSILQQWLNLNVDSNLGTSDEYEQDGNDTEKREVEADNYDLVNILIEYPPTG